MVEDLDDLEVGPGAEQEHDVARTEARVDTAVAELLAEELTDAASGADESVPVRLRTRGGSGACQAFSPMIWGTLTAGSDYGRCGPSAATVLRPLVRDLTPGEGEVRAASTRR